jgi:hypothetical protein
VWAQCANRHTGCKGPRHQSVLMLVQPSGKTEERARWFSESKQKALPVRNLPYSAILRGLFPSRDEATENIVEI